MKKKARKETAEGSMYTRVSLDPGQDSYLMRIGKGERLYKFYFFRPIAGRDWHFEYRIMTKEKSNGMLAMVSYNYKIVDGTPVKGGVMRAPEISKSDLESIVQNMMKRTDTTADEFEELDLSGFSSIGEQLEFLRAHDRADTMYIH